MDNTVSTRSLNILLVEDSPDDVELTMEAFKEGTQNHRLDVVEDGIEALNFLRRKGEYADAVRPDVILLDLNLPKKDGREVLEEIKGDEDLKYIPVIVLTTSRSEQDILTSYRLHANSYISKPVDLAEFFRAIKALEDFWLTVATLPSQARA